jgi:RNA polymerase sigma-70 factor (ECF subfamily)
MSAQPPEPRSDASRAATAEPRTLPRSVLDRLPRRDPAALEAFFDAYLPRVYGYVRRLVGDDYLAEDLTQEIFLQVHRSLESYDPDRDIRPWLFSIATNKVRDHWRSRRHREEQAEESAEQEGLAQMLSTVNPPDARLSAQELEERVRQAIEALPEGMRMTVLLRVWEGLTFEEIGRILERNDVAVRKRFSRALEVLRQALGTAWEAQAEGR